MSATNYTGQRSGMVNAANNSRALFLKLYAGEVMTAFQTKNIMMDYTRVRNIKKGKQAQFIMTGKHRTAAYHTPGAEIIPDTTAKNSERVVSIDDLLIVHQFIPNIDEAMAHYDIRSVYTQEAAYGLAKEADQNILRMAVKAALATNKERASKLIQDYNAWDDEDFTANVTYSSTNYANSKKSSNFFEGVLEAKRILEGAGAPLDDLVCVVSSDVYYHLFKAATNSEATTSLHMFNTDIGGSGSVVGANMPNIAGIPVVRTPHLGSDTGSAFTGSLFTTANPALTQGTAPLGSAESNRAAQYNLPATYTATTAGGSNTGAVGGLDGTSSVNLQTEANLIRALVMNKDAVATVKLLDLSVETDYMVNRQGTLIVSKYAMGHNVLRPAMAVALKASHNS
ncbi:MAG: putative minor capsid protein 10B [Prokaryotic dsDNA virus sp.]|mgnify:CR=1 FL=1|nr:MAG: putative minor capsid protein 10B [Prokaryotic dsDNA virus sp.]|tara:strand:- start:14535 stop:15725 length:1191 start_codon:yes stop_codon:yes gene_type:complete